MRPGFAFIILATTLSAAKTPEWDRANGLYLRTEYQQSLSVLAPVAKKDADTLELMGQNYFMLGDFKKATEVLERASEIAPKRGDIFHWLGRAYGRRAETGNPFTAPGYATKARQMFEKSVELDPFNKEAVNDLFDFYLEAPGILGGGLHKAQEIANRIAQTDPAEGHYAQAKIDEKRKEWDSAEQHLRRAAELAPRQVGRILDMAMYLSKRGRTKESEALFEQATQMSPDSPKVLYLRAETYIKEQRNLQEAKKLLERYLRSPLTPDDPSREQAQALLKKIGS